MQLNLTVLSIACVISGSGFAMEPEKIEAERAAVFAMLDMATTMPNATVLAERLEQSGFKELDHVTKLATLLANKRLSIISVTEQVEMAAQAYYMHKRDHSLRERLEVQQHALFGAVLSHDPRALAALTRCGLFPVPASDDRK